jgi:hypothetical protein
MDYYVEEDQSDDVEYEYESNIPDYAEDIEYKPDRDAYDRVAPGRPVDFDPKIFLGGSSKKLEDIYSRMFRLNISDEEKFKLAVNIFFNKFSDDLRLGQSDLDRLLDISSVKNIKFKNPICYIFGYYITSGSSAIDKKKLDKVVPLLSQVEDVTIEDVIRYSRFWLNKK